MRLDRMEPELNEAEYGYPRDTTTPAAMKETLGKQAFGSVLSETLRQQLIGWMAANAAMAGCCRDVSPHKGYGKAPFRCDLGQVPQKVCSTSSPGVGGSA
ncbi:hypothetical protein [Sinorhizobium sojae]|uniref:hypothetical protein n=1 Tax=Sinorhizobium sojae TaxID=716925 RepID=UPI00055174F1